MRRIKGFRGDSIIITSIDVVLTNTGKEMAVNAAIVDSTNNNSVISQTRCTFWGEGIEEKLNKFIETLEEDICRQVGQGGGRSESITDVLGESFES